MDVGVGLWDKIKEQCVTWRVSIQADLISESTVEAVRPEYKETRTVVDYCEEENIFILRIAMFSASIHSRENQRDTLRRGIGYRTSFKAKATLLKTKLPQEDLPNLHEIPRYWVLTDLLEK